MDLVQREAERQRLIARDTPSIWRGFRSALDELITSYGAAPWQPGWRLERDSVHDRSVLLTQHRGRAPDAWHEVTLIMTVVLDESAHAITIKAELVFARFEGSIVRESFSWKYCIDADFSSPMHDRASLVIDNALVSPLQAAEDLFAKTVFRTFEV